MFYTLYVHALHANRKTGGKIHDDRRLPLHHRPADAGRKFSFIFIISCLNYRGILFNTVIIPEMLITNYIIMLSITYVLDLYCICTYSSAWSSITFKASAKLIFTMINCITGSVCQSFSRNNQIFVSFLLFFYLEFVLKHCTFIMINKYKRFFGTV